MLSTWQPEPRGRGPRRRSRRPDRESGRLWMFWGRPRISPTAIRGSPSRVPGTGVENALPISCLPAKPRAVAAVGVHHRRAPIFASRAASCLRLRRAPGGPSFLNGPDETMTSDSRAPFGEADGSPRQVREAHAPRLEIGVPSTAVAPPHMGPAVRLLPGLRPPTTSSRTLFPRPIARHARRTLPSSLEYAAHALWMPSARLALEPPPRRPALSPAPTASSLSTCPRCCRVTWARALSRVYPTPISIRAPEHCP